MFKPFVKRNLLYSEFSSVILPQKKVEFQREKVIFNIVS